MTVRQFVQIITVYFRIWQWFDFVRMVDLPLHSMNASHLLPWLAILCAHRHSAFDSIWSQLKSIVFHSSILGLSLGFLFPMVTASSSIAFFFAVTTFQHMLSLLQLSKNLLLLKWKSINLCHNSYNYVAIEKIGFLTIHNTIDCIDDPFECHDNKWTLRIDESENNAQNNKISNDVHTIKRTA